MTQVNCVLLGVAFSFISIFVIFFCFLVRMMQLMSQMSSGLSGENLSQPAAGLSSNYFDMEAQKRIAENIRSALCPKKSKQNLLLFNSLNLFKIAKCSTKYGKRSRIHARRYVITNFLLFNYSI